MKHLAQIVIGIILITNPLTAFSQSVVISAEDEMFEKGGILTSFNIDVRAASKDENFNQEFEKSYEFAGFNFEGLYFINKNFGIGPIIGLQYVHRFYDAPGVIFQDEDQWSWNWEYGAKVGYFIPVNDVFKVEALGRSRLFGTAGLSSVRRKTKFEIRDTGSRSSFKQDPEMRYQVAIGLFIPLAKKIGLEWKLQRDVWERDYPTFEFDTNGNITSTGETTKWLSELSLGLGLKVKF